MTDGFLLYLADMQRAVQISLSGALRTGGAAIIIFAFALGALHALTPGHGKTALFAYFIGREARWLTGLISALAAALLHVVAGVLAFILLYLMIGRFAGMTDRGSTALIVAGQGLIAVAGIWMLVQAFRQPQEWSEPRPHALVAGIGLLPCPLTITVLGFALAQGSVAATAVVIASLAIGIAFTIGVVAVAAIAGRKLLAEWLAHRLKGITLTGRFLQGFCGFAILALGIFGLLRAI